ncbi:type I-E CRISPR-associated protein Cse1/CasA [Hydrocarboniclastica marina]|uniref:Type I-E CRISPR-associated protein Cse1/CasA n=1 Tax=Hydrocarboniclastica marina TaxID=2259620 RepID=A0A4P7XNK9_9ALTE|nr:type I-E CRISPR-associated protein Cse1/CasA [Hydrocarboniclastica marina]QCF28017.1 type I-E CRISPR-associated protein Cse1/CasA [Hydrocarboniclastica marina]
MRILTSQFLPFKIRTGDVEYRPVSAMALPEVTELALPRADFQGAAYQFLIGLLQTAYAPVDIDEWMDRYQSPPSPEALEQAFEGFIASFELEGDGPLFMQDLDPLDKESPIPSSSLLIDAPGASTIKNNTDHFVKAGRAEAFCPNCAAMALFTLQINAPSGGKGYRTGLRGGGPLTTLILPSEPDASLWKKLWLNVLDKSHWPYPEPNPKSFELFPWMETTRVSDKAQKTFASDVHPLHQFWAMPRRFRLIFEDHNCRCDLCGRDSERVCRTVKARNYGNNYDGPWTHPLTPYRRDPKKPTEPQLSVKGQPGGIGYRHWEALVLRDAEGSGNLPAEVVRDYARKVDEARHDNLSLPRQARLWVFGYDMDNMKPRAWYGTQLPLLAVPQPQQDRLLDWVRDLVGLSRDTAWQLRKQVKEAWFSRPADVKGDTDFIESRFWELTEHEFYSLLSLLGERIQDGTIKRLPPDLAARWYQHVRQQAVAVFDELALSAPAEALDMKRITGARNRFLYQLKKGKTAKKFRKQAGLEDAPLEQESA